MMAPMMTARPGMPPQGMPQVQPNANVGGGPNVRANYKYTAGVRNVAGGQVVPVAPQPVMQPQAPQAAVFIQDQEAVATKMVLKELSELKDNLNAILEVVGITGPSKSLWSLCDP